MNHIQPDSSEWKPCPLGALQEVQNHFHEQRQIDRRRFLKVVSAQMFVLMVGGLLIQSIDTTPHSQFGGITCSEVQTAIMNRQFNSLDDKTKIRIQTHLENCPHCTHVINNKSKADVLQAAPCFTASETNLIFRYHYAFTFAKVESISF
ncbi:zf-HC2 domain-containing protein [Gimesia panareensis]|uniref:zf-HC2 domain-containing protein n=1 Tax=Gimesia panareensis TaxID=2527978 RepID=UPI00118B245D|nr:zf-HC2 domain-containing protein [Gimesia panareensis]QDU52317.1 hypothetical protein Pan110_46910 [Gimesia panareensis]